MKKSRFGHETILIYSVTRLDFTVSLYQIEVSDNDNHDHVFYIRYVSDYNDKYDIKCKTFVSYSEALAFYKEKVTELVKNVPVHRSFFSDWSGDVLPF